MSQIIEQPPRLPGPAGKPGNQSPSNEPGKPPAHDNHDEHGEHGIPKDLKAPSAWAITLAVILFAVLLVGLFALGYIPQHREEMQAKSDAEERAKALPEVQITHPQLSPGTHEIILPCDVKANKSTAIYTRINGYLNKWFFDIGQPVKEGDLLATIDTPEVDAQLAQTQAAEKQNEAAVDKAKADLDLAQVTYQRYVDAQKTSPGSVTKEDVDTHKSQLDDAVQAVKQAQANVEAAKATVQQLQATQGFNRIYAPFSGTITARNYDRGALLSPTDTTPGKEMFDLAQTDTLRVFVNVPQEYANFVGIGQSADLFIRSFPSTPFKGQVYTTAGAVDPNTRTLPVQINFPNKDGKLLAGEYGEVHLPVEDTQKVYIIPTSALIFNAAASGPQAAVVTEGDKINMKRIQTGRDFGTSIEVVSGVTDTDKVVVNPSERTSEGAQVKATMMAVAPVPAAIPVNRSEMIPSATTRPATAPSAKLATQP